MNQVISTRSESAALAELTPEGWAKARAILSGEDPKRVSKSAAARAAGIRVATLNAWIRRSAERLPEDEPWTYEIAEVAADMDAMQSGQLEDVAWDHAVNGVEEKIYYQGRECGTKNKFDHGLLMKLIEVRDERYKSKPAVQNNVLVTDSAEIFRRLRAQERMKQIGDER